MDGSVMKTEIATSLWVKLAMGIATAATLAGGTAVIKGAETNAVQNQRLGTLERTIMKIDTLNDNLQETSKEVALLRQELEAQREYPRDRRDR